MDRSIVNVVSRGALVEKSLDEAKELISRIVENFQQFGKTMDGLTRNVS